MSPNDVKLRWRIADTYQQLGKLDLAADHLEAITRLEPTDEAALLSVGNARLSLQQHSKAEKAYRGVIKRWPKSDEGWNGLAVALFHQEQYLQALGAARKAVHIDREEPNNLYVLGIAALEYAMQFPDSQTHSPELTMARRNLTEVLRVWPEKGDLYLQLGRACAGLRDGKSALKYLRRAAELMPHRADVIEGLSRVYIAQNDRTTPLRLVEKGLVHNPKSAVLYDLLGQLVQTSGEPNARQRALDAFHKATELAPDRPFFFDRLGMAYLRAGKIEEARKAFVASIRLDANRPLPYQQLAAIYTRQGRPDLATECAKSATAMVFNEQQLRRIEALSAMDRQNVILHLILADRYRDLGLKGLSRDEYLIALRIDPDNARAKKGLSDLAKLRSKTSSRG